MKRDSSERQTEPESADVAAPEGEEVATDASGDVATQEGAIPEVAEATENEEKLAAAPTASEQAYEEIGPKQSDSILDQKPEDEIHKAAEQYNEDHPHRVAEFNQLTEDACMHHGKLDIEKVRDFQKEQKLEEDGKVGPWTLAAAKDVAEIRDANRAEQKAVTDKQALENKPETAKEEKPTKASVAKTEIAPEVVAPELVAADPKVAGEKAADAAKEPSNTEVAMAWNLEHASQVAEFNELTEFASTTNGQIDIEKVISFQRMHGLNPDGRIGHDTIEAAKKSAEPVAPAAVAEVVSEAAPQMA
jgi:peptidoglycan hydrolase-like protein with peptidoglycan-binding domain